MNETRYIKTHISGRRSKFLFKTPTGFKKYVEKGLQTWFSQNEMSRVSLDASSNERGVVVSGLNLREATLVALTQPGLTDFLYLISEEKAGHETDLSKINYKKLVFF